MDEFNRKLNEQEKREWKKLILYLIGGIFLLLLAEHFIVGLITDVTNK